MKYQNNIAKIAIFGLFGCTLYGAVNPYESIENQRQFEKEQQLKQQQEQTPNVKLQKPLLEATEIPDDESPCFQINKISVLDDSGEFGWATSELNSYTKKVLPRCLGKGGVSAIMKKLQNIIIAKGYVTTRVSAKPQDLTKGTLELSIVAGKAKNIKVSEDAPYTRIFTFNSLPVKKGDIVNIYDIEQGLENLKRPPTSDADITFSPSQDKDSNAGDSDLNIKYKQSFPARFNATIDDGGGKGTGRYQGSATLSLDNIIGLSELFYISLNKDFGGGDRGDRGTKGSTVYFAVPYNYWLFSFDSSVYEYRQTVAGESNEYVYSGNNFSQSITLSNLIYRDNNKKIKLSLSGWKKTSNSYIDGNIIELQLRRTIGADMALNYSQTMRYASIDTTITYKTGLKKLNALEAPESDTDGGSSFPKIAKMDATLYVPFAPLCKKCALTINYKSQKNQTPLIPNDYFYIGGRYSVRGFDGANTLASERGYTLSNEFVVSDILYGVGAYVGIDHGEVDGRNTDTLIGRSLSGGVIGIRGKNKYFTYDFFVGKPLKKPSGFETSSIASGFTLNFSI